MHRTGTGRPSHVAAGRARLPRRGSGRRLAPGSGRPGTARSRPPVLRGSWFDPQRGPAGGPGVQRVRADPVVEPQAAGRTEQDVLAELGFLADQAAREVTARDLLVHGVGLDVLVEV